MPRWARAPAARALSVVVRPRPDATAPLESFTSIELEHTTLIRSNLGGQSGRCYSRTNPDTGLCFNPAPEVYFANVSTSPGVSYIDLRIRNETECAGAPRSARHKRARRARERW